MTNDITRLLKRHEIPRIININQVGETVLIIIEKIKPIRSSQLTHEKLKKIELQKLLKLIFAL